MSSSSIPPGSVAYRKHIRAQDAPIPTIATEPIQQTLSKSPWYSDVVSYAQQSTSTHPLAGPHGAGTHRHQTSVQFSPIAAPILDMAAAKVQEQQPSPPTLQGLPISPQSWPSVLEPVPHSPPLKPPTQKLLFLCYQSNDGQRVTLMLRDLSLPKAKEHEYAFEN